MVEYSHELDSHADNTRRRRWPADEQDLWWSASSLMAEIWKTLNCQMRSWGLEDEWMIDVFLFQSAKDWKTKTQRYVWVFFKKNSKLIVLSFKKNSDQDLSNCTTLRSELKNRDPTAIPVIYDLAHDLARSPLSTHQTPCGQRKLSI